MSIDQWLPEKLQQSLINNQPLLILDVREDNEFAYARLQGSVLIPLNQLPNRLDELDREQDIVVVCHHGMRSQQACRFLHQAGFSRVYNLQGGIDAWSLACDSSVPRY